MRFGWRAIRRFYKVSVIVWGLEYDDEKADLEV